MLVLTATDSNMTHANSYLVLWLISPGIENLQINMGLTFV